MLVLKPICHETVWGGSRISEYTGVEGDSIGHLYSIYCRAGISNEILNGEWAGKTLNEAFPLFKNKANMGEYEYFPLTIALTEADANLSIQVHPNDAVANSIEHKARGKRESWCFIEAPADGYIINGCVCKSEEEKDKMLANHKYLEMCDRLNVGEGDYVFVEPGTLHSITAGSLVYEIEEGADFTYRFFDYDRLDKSGKKRELHIEKASFTLDMSLKSQVQRYIGANWINEKTYATKKLTSVTGYRNDDEELHCLTLINGKAVCDGDELAPGMTAILWPGEEIVDADIRLGFVAKSRRNEK